MRELHLNEKRTHGTSDFPLGYYYVTEVFSRYEMEQHWHLQYEIIHIIEGEFLLKLTKENHPLAAGDYAFINAGILHGGVPKSCVYECVVFNMDFLRNRNYRSDAFMKQLVHNKFRIQTVFSAAALEDVPVLRRALEGFFQAFHQGGEYYELGVQANLLLFMSEVAKHRMYIYANDKSADVENIEPIKKSLEMIQNSYSEDLTLEDLAKTAGLSSKYFCHIFQKLMGRTPIDYLNHYRIERAACLIEENKLPLIHICYDCGFNDYSYFIRVFKKYKHITPNQYKKTLV